LWNYFVHTFFLSSPCFYNAYLPAVLVLFLLLLLFLMFLWVVGWAVASQTCLAEEDGSLPCPD